jgi:DNA-binding transcriptional regulator YiaG
MTTINRSAASIRRHRPSRIARARLANAAEDDAYLSSEHTPMPALARQRIKDGRPKPSDLVAFRAMLGLSQPAFSTALGIQVATLRNWEQGRRTPEGPAIALLRLAARHPRLLLESLTIAE